MACDSSKGSDVISGAETVIGRARWRGDIALLTDAPALVFVDDERVAMRRQPLHPSGIAVTRLWGLAEDHGRLFTTAAFNRLVEIDGAGTLKDIAALSRAVLNLLDLDAGMAVQLASQGPGSPLLVALDPSGGMAPWESPLRSALGLTPPEEGLLHLLSCSVPPGAICWLPGDIRIFASEGRALVHLTQLMGLSPPAPATLIAVPEGRVIEDALHLGRDGIIVLRNVARGGPQRLTRYALDGTAVMDVAPPEPLRLLLAHSARRILAVARTGRLTVVEM